VNAPLVAAGRTGDKWSTPMIRINAAWLISVTEAIDAIDKLVPGETVLDGIGILFGAQGALEQVLDQSFYRDHVRASRAAGKALYEAVTALLDANDDWSTKKIEQCAAGAIGPPRTAI
jgi:hypothetical protein